MTGGDYDFGARIYDSRIARWWKIDLFYKELPNITPYRFGLNNPMRFSDGDGNFEIDEATAKAYPKLNSYLKNIAKVYADKPEAFRAAFKKYSELSDEQIKTMLEYKLVKTGTPVKINQPNPRIVVRPLTNANGQTGQSVDIDLNSNTIIKISNEGTIVLNKSLVDEFEKTHNSIDDMSAAKLVLESTIFHEGTHYGDALSDGKPTQTRMKIVDGQVVVDETNGIGLQEGGKAFEQAVYGEDIDPSNAKSYIEKHRAPMTTHDPNTKSKIAPAESTSLPQQPIYVLPH